LEWIEAGSLDEHPGNWRRHSKEQLASIREMLDDEEVGWAGACLYNERTGRLVDGHARKQVVDPATPVPVLVGNWSEAAEAKILATLDPLASMATGDADAFQALVDQVNFDGLFTRDMVEQLEADMLRLGEGDEEDGEAGGEQDDSQPGPPRMELEPFEHYDYVLVLARNVPDWEALCDRLGLEKRDVSRVPDQTKIGLGRAIDAARLIALLDGQEDSQ
jgi:hypothetical protein